MTSPESITTISRHILEKIDNFQVGTTGIILGSGLGEAITKLDNTIEIPYCEIPGLPQSTVKGHSGSLIYGFMQKNLYLYLVDVFISMKDIQLLRLALQFA